MFVHCFSRLDNDDDIEMWKTTFCADNNGWTEASRVRPRHSCHMLHRCVHEPVGVLAPDWVLNVEMYGQRWESGRYCRESTRVTVTAITLVNNIYTAESRQHTYRVAQPIRQTSGWRGDMVVEKLSYLLRLSMWWRGDSTGTLRRQQWDVHSDGEFMPQQWTS